MVSGIDPALLVFAGRFLSQGGGDPSNGFGNALGAGLEAAGGHALFKQEQARIKQQDMVKNAESAIAMRKALQEIQAGDLANKQAREQQQAQQDFLQTVPENERAAAAVNPQAAALLETQQANPAPLTEDQKADNALQQEQFNYQKYVDERNFKAQQRQQLFANELAKAKASKPKPETVAGLRKEYTSASKEFGVIRDSYKKLLATQDTAAGDLSLVFSYMKMLDPNSVVREQEFANAQNAAGVPDRIRNMYNKVLSGQFLGANQRTEFKEQAEAIYEQQYNTQIDQRTSYGEIASRANVDPRDILDQVSAPAPQQIRAEQLDARMNALGVNLSVMDQASQQTGAPMDLLVGAMEESGLPIDQLVQIIQLKQQQQQQTGQAIP